MSSPNRFSVRFTWGGGGKKCFSDSCILLFTRRVGKHARTHLHELVFAPCCGLVYHFSNAKVFFDLFSKCNMQSPLGQLAEHHCIIDKVQPPLPQNLIMRFSSLFSLTPYGLPTRFSQEEELWTAKRSHITLYPQCHCISKCGLLWCTSRLPTAKITWL